MTFKNTLALAIAGALTLSPLALAQDTGNPQPGRFAINVGGAHLSPSNDTGALADGALEASIDGGNAATLGLAWFFNDNFALELWGSPDKFNHTVSLNGLPGADISHRPVALSGQYHFNVSDQFRPFVGLGYHHTNVDNERGRGALEGQRVGIETGEGPMATLGMDYLIGERWYVRTDVRYMHWRSDVAVNGIDVGEAKVDPWVAGLSIGARF